MPSPLPPPSSPPYARVEIHHISVSAGDATVIVTRINLNEKEPDKLILIDAGKSWDDLKIILTYTSEEFGRKSFDYIILSHDHEDHHGALPYGDLLSKERTTFVCGPSITGTFRNSTLKNITRVKIEERIDLGEQVSLTCYCAANIIAQQVKLMNNPGFDMYEYFIDDNDLSLACLLEYKEFRYFTAGDLSGADEGRYKNVEAPLLNYLFGGPHPKINGPINILKASHHGSKFSSFGGPGNCTGNANSLFLKTMNPEIIVVPCHNSITPPLPTSEFFERVWNNPVSKIKQVYLVNVFKRPLKKESGKHLPFNWNKQHIVNFKIGEDTDVHGNTTEVYTNATNQELPAVVFYIDAEGTYSVNADKKIKLNIQTKSFKIKKVLRESIPDIPGFYLTRKKGTNITYLEDTLMSRKVNGRIFTEMECEKIIGQFEPKKDDIGRTSKQKEMHDNRFGKLKYLDKKYTLKQKGLDLKAISDLREFDAAYNLFKVFKAFPEVPRTGLLDGMEQRALGNVRMIRKIAPNESSLKRRPMFIYNADDTDNTNNTDTRMVTE